MTLKLSVIGCGYLGATHAACMSSLGFEVIGIDTDQNKVDLLSKGELPFYEPGLDTLLAAEMKTGRLSFSTDFSSVKDADVHFICVGTPQSKDGLAADLTYVKSSVAAIAPYLKDGALVVGKSTVPVGTAQLLREQLAASAPQADLAWNPEFLREGAAIDDFMHPDRIVVGVEDEKSRDIMGEIYQAFASQSNIVYCDITTAELIKYASNSFLATKISFINEMADLCEVVGANVKSLSYAMGLDSRIGEKFLNPGPGFGGSCFPKDIMAILNVAKEKDVNLSLIQSVITSNAQRKVTMSQKIVAAVGGDVKDKKIALLGLAFKANTDDIRYSPAIVIAKELSKSGALIAANDPEAMDKLKTGISEKLKANIPMKRFADVMEQVNSMLWLCSNEASFITGQAISVDGGITA